MPETHIRHLTSDISLKFPFTIYQSPFTIRFVDQSQHELLVGLEEMVEQTALDLDELRAATSKGRPPRKLIDTIFRRVHTVKGSAATFGLTGVSQVAHEFESLLAAIREGNVEVDADVIDLSEAAMDALSESLSLAASGSSESSHKELFEQLQAAASSRPERQSEPATLEMVPAELLQGLDETEKRRLAKLLEKGWSLFVVRASFRLDDLNTVFAQLQEQLNNEGEIIATFPAADPANPDTIKFRLIYTTDRLDTTSTVGNAHFESVLTGSTPPPLQSNTITSVSSQSNFVRADLDRLDSLISSAHELFRLATNTLEFALSQHQWQPEIREELVSRSNRVRQSFLGLEDELINLRMVSLGPTLQRAMRAGRAVARASVKEIDFKIIGSDLRVDKMLADAIADPLIHLVRNAVDHGIEVSAERLRAGKNARGTIRIEATEHDSQTVIRVIDDGRGIDPELISQAASRLGIQGHSGPLDLERSLRLIFRPGFSTAVMANDVSGRGVGLDIVETSVEQAGGQLRISSRAGAGTTFEIRLPVTFGLLSATVIVSDGNRYCIPSSRASTDRNAKAGAEVSLRELLGQPAANNDCQTLLNYEYPENGNTPKRVRVVVDQVEGNQEVLVRNLGRHSGRWTGVVGATELRDGSVALVLDLQRLLTRSERD
ncbi:MAG TPA: ATP-binding protein [Pyrinomonadaceae bacterium]|nr:ATP-binding protein [Pyrinomonadaceae bacterium]